MIESAQALWSRLDGDRQAFMERCEEYSALSVRRVLADDGRNKEADELARDYQSIGMEGSLNVSNKLMLTLFRPSRPCFKLGLSKVAKASLVAMGAEPEDYDERFAEVERDASAAMERNAYRVKLQNAFIHLIVTGNTMMLRTKGAPRVMGLRYWCVKRNIDQSVNTLIVKETVEYDELSPEVQAAVPLKKSGHGGKNKVAYYRVFKLDKNRYREEQWVDEVHLNPKRFDKSYPKDNPPFIVATWNLEDNADYGTGLIEDCANDLRAVSVMGTACVEGVVGLLNWRLLVNPSGVTKAEDFKNSRAGDAINGTKEDIDLTSGGSPEAVAQALAGMTQWERRLARMFLLLSAVTRDAERVTAEEIRMQAMELDTVYGGVYSSLALQIQKPLALWILEDIDFDVHDSEIEVTVITGLDSLSRNADLENLRTALADLAMLASLPQEVQNRIKMDQLILFIGQGRGISLKRFVRSDQEYNEFMDAMQARIIDQQNAIAQGAEAAKGTA